MRIAIFMPTYNYPIQISQVKQLAHPKAFIDFYIRICLLSTRGKPLYVILKLREESSFHSLVKVTRNQMNTGTQQRRWSAGELARASVGCD